VGHWTLKKLGEKMIKIGAKGVRHARYMAFQMAELAALKCLRRAILRRLARLYERTMPTPG
jgi:hypothetical protein